METTYPLPDKWKAIVTETESLRCTRFFNARGELAYTHFQPITDLETLKGFFGMYTAGLTAGTSHGAATERKRLRELLGVGE